MFKKIDSFSLSFYGIARRCLNPMGLLIVMLFSLTCLASTQFLPAVNASGTYTGEAKPMEFYFHRMPAPLPLGSGYTYDSHVMNTTRLWGGTQRIGPQAGSFDIYFYLAPDIAGNLPVNGTFWLHLWANATGATPSAVFDITVYELSASGFLEVGSWTSGSEDLSPEVYDVNAIAGNSPLKFTIPSYTFSSGSSVALKITIKPGAATQVSLWYDSALYPSQVLIYAQDYARPSSVRTSAYDNSETNMFYYNVGQDQRVVTVRANITDPLGGYDINSVNMTILDPFNNPVVNNVEMDRKTDGQWLFHFSHIYEANWSYPETVQLGNYTVEISVTDNNGYYHNLVSGSFAPFVESKTHIFTIGIIVYYDPAVLVVDDVGVPLSHAPVYITWPNGSRDTLPRFTSSNGFINLTHVLPANYNFTVFWKDVVVNQTSLYLDSDGPYTIQTQVYQLTVEVVANTGSTVQGAYVIVYTQTGIGYGLGVTDETGQVTFKLPIGTYDIETHYSTGYWLSIVTTSGTEPSVSVTSSMPATVTLAAFPPLIWSTTGFLLFLAFIIAAALGTVGFLYRKGVIFRS